VLFSRIIFSLLVYQIFMSCFLLIKAAYVQAFVLWILVPPFLWWGGASAAAGAPSLLAHCVLVYQCTMLKPVQTPVGSAWLRRLLLRYDDAFSCFAFNFLLRPYSAAVPLILHGAVHHQVGVPAAGAGQGHAGGAGGSW